jgi:hypothetical protein
MRSIFWIGCILTVLVLFLASGAVAETDINSTVQKTVAQVENVTDVAKEAAAAAGVKGAENVTEPVKEAVKTVGAVAEKVENLTETVKEVTMTAGKEEKVNATLAVGEGNKTAVQEKVTAEPDLVNDTLVKFVKDARAKAAGSGRDGALVAFRNPVGGYVNDKMYIFAYDYDGKVLANPVNPGIVGQNQIGLSDSTGFKYIQQMRDVARKGGFVTYQEPNLMKKGAIEQKTSYVIDVDGTYWIGAGVYKSKDVAKPAAVPAKNETASNLTNTTAEIPVEVSIPASNVTESVVAANTTAPNATAKTA